MNIRKLSAAVSVLLLSLTEIALATAPTGVVSVSDCQTFRGAPVYIDTAGLKQNMQEGQPAERIEDLRIYVLDDSGTTLVVRDVHGELLGRTTILASQYAAAEGEYSVCGSVVALLASNTPVDGGMRGR